MPDADSLDKTPRPSPNPLTPQYKEAITFRTEDGLLVQVTERQYNGQIRHSFSFFKEWDSGKDMGVRRSHWFEKRHLVGIRKLCDELEEWLDGQMDRQRTRLRHANGKR